MRRVAGAIVAVTVVTGLVACGSPEDREATEAPRALDELLYVRAGSGIAAVPTGAGESPFAVDQGIASPDGFWIYATRTRGDVTRLEMLDAASGSNRASMRVEGAFEARVAAATGGLVALGVPHAPGGSLYMPAGRSRTSMVVAQPIDGTSRRYELDGNFEPEAFSTDGRELFVIEYIPALDPDRYRVRRLKLHSGEVAPIGRLKTAAPGQMRGTGRVQVYAPSLDELYTLYTRQTTAGHGGEEKHPPGHVHAFVHLLNLSGKWAHCIDLPMPFGMGDATAHAIAVSTDGRRLYVVDPSTQSIASIRPSRLRVADTATIDIDPDVAVVSASVGRDGTLYVGAGNEILAIDPNSLEVVARFDVSDDLSSVATSADGSILYAAASRGITLIDPASGDDIRTIPVGGIDSIERASPLD